MPNITVTVSEDAYRKARVWAAENDTSVSAVVQYCIEHLPRLPLARRAVAPMSTANRDCETVKGIKVNPSGA